MKNKELQIIEVPIELVEYNIGQIPDVPENPRTREDERQRALEKNIEELPEMATARPPLCYPFNGRFVALDGNRRLEAHRNLNRKKIPVILLPENISKEKLRRIVILGNESTGETDWNKIAAQWDISELKSWNAVLPSNFVSPDDFGTAINLTGGGKKPYQQMTFTLADAQAEEIKELMSLAKREDAFKESTFTNSNVNGNILYYILHQWAEQRKYK